MASLRIPASHLFKIHRLSKAFSTEGTRRIENLNQQNQKLLTVPNILTLSRIAATPAIGYFIWNGMHSQALTCFAIAATTDLLDGFIARRFNQSSDVGAILDPVADKFLLTTCFVAMYNTNMLPLWLVKGFISRDLILLMGGATIRYFGFDEKPGFKKFLDLKNYPTVGFEPTLVSKCNTALQCLLIILHLAEIPNLDMLHFVTAATSCISLGQYGTRLGKAYAFKWNKKAG